MPPRRRKPAAAPLADAPPLLPAPARRGSKRLLEKDDDSDHGGCEQSVCKACYPEFGTDAVFRNRKVGDPPKNPAPIHEQMYVVCALPSSDFVHSRVLAETWKMTATVVGSMFEQVHKVFGETMARTSDAEPTATLKDCVPLEELARATSNIQFACALPDCNVDAALYRHVDSILLEHVDRVALSLSELRNAELLRGIVVHWKLHNKILCTGLKALFGPIDRYFARTASVRKTADSARYLFFARAFLPVFVRHSSDGGAIGAFVRGLNSARSNGAMLAPTESGLLRGFVDVVTGMLLANEPAPRAIPTPLLTDSAAAPATMDIETPTAVGHSVLAEPALPDPADVVTVAQETATVYESLASSRALSGADIPTRQRLRDMFEEFVSRGTSSHYATVASDRLVTHTLSAYMVDAEKSIEHEAWLVNTIFETSSELASCMRTKLAEHCNEELLDKHHVRIFAGCKDDSESVASWLASARPDEADDVSCGRLGRLLRLYLRLPSGVEYFATAVKNHALTSATRLVSANNHHVAISVAAKLQQPESEVDKDKALRIVPAFVSLTKQLGKLVTAVASDLSTELSKAIHDGLQHATAHAVYGDCTFARLFSVYLNHLVSNRLALAAARPLSPPPLPARAAESSAACESSAAASPDTTLVLPTIIQTELEDTTRAVAYVANSDDFLEHFRSLLCSRLMSWSRAIPQKLVKMTLLADKTVVALLTKSLGPNGVVQNIKCMINEYGLVDSIRHKYSQSVQRAQAPQSFDMHVLVASAHQWNVNVSNAVAPFHPLLDAERVRFAEFFKSTFHERRVFTFLRSAGTCNVEFRFKRGPGRLFDLTTLQACLILQFQEHDTLTVGQIADTACLSVGETMFHMRAFMMDSMRVLSASGSADAMSVVEEVLSGSTKPYVANEAELAGIELTFNEDFAHASSKIRATSSHIPYDRFVEIAKAKIAGTAPSLARVAPPQHEERKCMIDAAIVRIVKRETRAGSASDSAASLSRISKARLIEAVIEELKHRFTADPHIVDTEIQRMVSHLAVIKEHVEDDASFYSFD